MPHVSINELKPLHTQTIHTFCVTYIEIPVTVTLLVVNCKILAGKVLDTFGSMYFVCFQSTY